MKYGTGTASEFLAVFRNGSVRRPLPYKSIYDLNRPLSIYEYLTLNANIYPSTTLVSSRPTLSRGSHASVNKSYLEGEKNRRGLNLAGLGDKSFDILPSPYPTFAATLTLPGDRKQSVDHSAEWSQVGFGD